MNAVTSASDAGRVFRIRLPASPYPGLRPFEKDEWPIYFGRERMADAVVGGILKNRVLVLHGDSGCGKSSLVRAAVLPKLEQENARGSLCWRTCIALPGQAPLWNLAEELARIDGAQPDPEQVRQFRRALNFRAGAPAAIAELLKTSADGLHVCILIDQFEELFEYARRNGPGEARLLTDFLLALHASPPDGLYCVLTMRSEFIGTCGRYAGLAELVNATQYLLPRMDHDDLQRAICEPATLYGGTVSRELALRLIADTATEQDQLPLIQHGLMLMHRRLVDDNPEVTAIPLPETGEAGGTIPARSAHPAWRLGLHDYPKEGGLSGLLSMHADALMQEAQKRFPPAAESVRVVEELFRALTEINAEGQALRRPRTLRDLIAVTGGDEVRLRGIIDLYRSDGASLLRPYGDAPLELTERIDIGHEALIRCWRRLGGDQKDGWLFREFRSGMLWRALLVQAESFEAEPSNVLPPIATEEREQWIRQRNPAWAERYGGGWERVKSLLAASAAAREQLRRQEQRTRWLKGLGAAGVLLAIFLAFALWQWFQAEEELKFARQQFEVANAARQQSEDLKRKSVEAQEELTRSLADLDAAIKQKENTSRALEQLRRQLEEQVKRSASKPAAPDTRAVGPRVYIQIAAENQRRGASVLEKYLERIRLSSGRVNVPGIQLVKSAPKGAVLRCYRTIECDNEGRRLVAAVNRVLLSTKLELEDLSGRYGDSAQIGQLHFEIWFNEGEIVVREEAQAQ